MARGWESKSVESQIESSEEGKGKARKTERTAEQLQMEREREILLLSRTRTLEDLKAATNPRYRELLEATLKHLEERLQALSPPAV